MRIGVIGGTFDPIHIGHLVIAEEAAHQFNLVKVIFVPSARPPHKRENEQAPEQHRLRMVELATDTNPLLEASDMEIRRKGLSFTIETLRELHGNYGPDTELFFIIGADAILEISTWKDPGGLLAESKFIAATRPGYSMEKLWESIPEYNSDGDSAIDRVLKMEIPALEVSSTGVRQRVAEGRPFRYLVPEAVWRYIREKGLYRQR